MSGPRRREGGAAGLALLLGALAWLPARHGVMTTWDTTWLGLGYVGWNRVMLVPLTLLAGGAVGAARRARTRPTRVGWWIVAGGFGLAWIGVVVEFVVGGGLRGGPVALAMAGWSAYVLGTVVAGAGAGVLAVGLARDRAASRRAVAATAAGLAAVCLVGWPVLLLLDRPELGVVDQMAAGLAWAVVAMTAPGRAAAAAR